MTDTSGLKPREVTALYLLTQGALYVADHALHMALLRKGFTSKNTNMPWLCNITAEGEAALKAAQEADHA